jgi:hypothetical protein
MIIQRVGRCLLIAGVLSMMASTAMAQQPSGGRRTDQEYLERGFDLMDSPSYPRSLKTPEERARYEKYQVNRFQQNVEKLSKLGKEEWAALYDSASDRRAQRKLEDMAEDLEKIAREMMQFLEWRFQVEPLAVDGSAEANVRERVAGIRPMVEQVTNTVPLLAGSSIPVQTFVELRQNLARIHLLSRSLRR